MLKSDSTVDGLKVQKKDRLLAITFNGTDAVRLAITFNGTNACKVPELLFQPAYIEDYIEEHISGVRKVSFKKEKKLVKKWLVIFEDLWYFSLQVYFSNCHFLKFSVT